VISFEHGREHVGSMNLTKGSPSLNLFSLYQEREPAKSSPDRTIYGSPVPVPITHHPSPISFFSSSAKKTTRTGLTAYCWNDGECGREGGGCLPVVHGCSAHLAFCFTSCVSLSLRRYFYYRRPTKSASRCMLQVVCMSKGRLAYNNSATFAS